MTDTPKYYAIATGADTANFKEVFRCRVLVPYVARPFYWFARAYLHTWDAGFFGLLMANALFCATTACFIVSIGNRVLNDPRTALLGATLYLLSFGVSNLQLAGLIDTGEACFMAAVVWSLLTGRWYLLPLWGILGALAKETFVPFSFVFVFSWWLTDGLRSRPKLADLNWARFKWIVVLALVGLITVTAVHAAVIGQLRLPWTFAGEARNPGSFFANLWRCFSEPVFWYIFGWLIPLGIWRLQVFPRSWLLASIVASILAILLGASINTGGNVGRAVFDIIGPLLSLSVALLITETLENRTRNVTASESG